MGKLKRRRLVKGTISLAVMIGLMVTIVLVTNYFQANAAGETSNHGKNETIKKAVAANAHTAKREQELHRKQQEKARDSKQKEPESTPAETATASAAPNNTAPQTTPTDSNNANQTQPVTTQPATNNKTVYLTFDDGPSAISGEIIALLEQYKTKATFFMIDSNIRRYPDAVKLMVNTGEAVGLHSVSHKKDVFYASAGSVVGELTQNRNTLLEISGIDSFLMRTPYGSSPYMTDEYKAAVEANGYHMWDWNIDSKDWYYKDERFVNEVIQQINAKANHPGPLVILLHERRETLANLPKLLDYLAQQGFECKAIDSSMVPVQF